MILFGWAAAAGRPTFIGCIDCSTGMIVCICMIAQRWLALDRMSVHYVIIFRDLAQGLQVGGIFGHSILFGFPTQLDSLLHFQKGDASHLNKALHGTLTVKVEMHCRNEVLFNPIQMNVLSIDQ